MSNIVKSVKLDNYILKSYYKAGIGIYALAAVIAVLTKTPALAMAIVLIVSAPITGLYYSVYEKENLSKLYGVLPVARSEVVIGRYLYALSICIVNGILAGVWAYVISLFTGYGMDHLTFSAVLSASFLFFCLFIALLFPVYSKFPFSKVYIFANLPIYLVGIASLYVVRRTNFLSNIGQITRYFTANQEMIWIAGIGAGLILLAVSLLLSCLIYQKREL